MYPSIFKEAFPCGIGFEWIRENNFFHKNLMTASKISMGSVEWIDYMSNDKRFINKKGERQIIISGWMGNEKKIGNYLVDGFCCVDDKVFVLEFDGCFHHKCRNCGFVPTAGYIQVIKLKNTEEKY